MNSKRNCKFELALLDQLRLALGEKAGDSALSVLKEIGGRGIALENAASAKQDAEVAFEMLPWLGPCLRGVLAEVFGPGQRCEDVACAIEKAAVEYEKGSGKKIREPHRRCAFYFVPGDGEEKLCIALKSMRQANRAEPKKSRGPLRR
jgi:hypothetical protein